MSQQLPSSTTHSVVDSYGPNTTATPLERPNPFESPSTSSANSWIEGPRQRDRESGRVEVAEIRNRYFRSRRIRKEDLESPKNLQSSRKRSIFQKQTWLIPCLGIFVGICITGVLIYFGLGSQHGGGKFCPILDEDFSSGVLSPDIWTIEQQVGGYGNGHFDQTTDDPDVVFVDGGLLHLKPGLQDQKLIETDGATIDLGSKCTGDTFFGCFAHTNVTNGTIVPPVRSARVNTRKGASIKYGRVEVTAKMPKGDWLWPAIWMLPTDDVYGTWPASGEIDIAETRGNNHSYNAGPGGGNDIVTSALHWGPESKMDSYLQTWDQLSALHSEFGDKFHTFGVEWTDKYIYTYVDSVLLQVLYVPFTQRFWDRGHYAASTANGTALMDPWSRTGRLNTPFDQKFYLILNVAVGGTNGYFKDSAGGKPWADASPVARKEFWQARDQWFPTWQKSGEMQVKSVKMWEKC
ncbi:hypothetical protein PRZ48_005071 [Zasmidium cellare]|uniref:GH16 domain-containing protein n=1 Tax=Zasmidium cellare TaxID=395010 RepID=A0ABR0ERN3_ZASCE|nr:hypothetical protein PRZ48_005071 [Zasmidium cellare]